MDGPWPSLATPCPTCLWPWGPLALTTMVSLKSRSCAAVRVHQQANRCLAPCLLHGPCRRLPWLFCSANVVCACLCTLYPLLTSNSRAAANSGSIRLSFDGVVSARIPWDADHDTLYLALTGIDSLYAVQVVMDGTTHQLCSAGNGSLTTVTIVHPQVEFMQASQTECASDTCQQITIACVHSPALLYRTTRHALCMLCTSRLRSASVPYLTLPFVCS